MFDHAVKIILLSLFMAPPAFAVGGIQCLGVKDEDVFINVTTGRLTVLTARASNGAATYATQPNPGETEIMFGQSMSETNRTVVGFTDPNIERIVSGGVRTCRWGGARAGQPGVDALERAGPIWQARSRAHWPSGQSCRV